jgi:hypothetical protein
VHLLGAIGLACELVYPAIQGSVAHESAAQVGQDESRDQAGDASTVSRRKIF